MGKTRFTFEYEFNASKKMLYPYFASASGLAQWFAEDVNVDEDGNLNFIWEGIDHKAKLVSHRTNSYAKFVFLEDNEEGPDSDWVEFKIELNEMTETTFVKVTEYADFEDKDEQTMLWEGLLQTLKELVGG
ncbi:MAG: START-like domain-containing protein [Cyclobacteriaceae bacterium]|nr:START-like domain-containing protein [Cyclobacteriaceae bacterium]